MASSQNPIGRSIRASLRYGSSENGAKRSAKFRGSASRGILSCRMARDMASARDLLGMSGPKLMSSKLIRLFVVSPLVAGGEIVLAPPQAHYLINVMRCKTGNEILVFNG